MSTARTKQRTTAHLATAAATEALGTWGMPTAFGVVALAAACATSFGVVPASVGLAITILGALGLVAERGLVQAIDGASAGTAAVVAIGVVWLALCYLPFHLLLFPGAPLHQPITLHGADASLPVTIPTRGRHAVDLMLEARLPQNPGGATAIPVRYAVTVDDAASAQQVLTGRFEESLNTRRLGRRGTATVVHAHHGERRLLSNPAGGDVTISAVSLEPAAGATLTVTAYAHHLPPTPVLVAAVIAILATAIAVDARVVPAAGGVLTYATPAALGAALALWTSNTVHPTVSSLIGSLIFGGPLGLGLGAGLWAIARRTLVDDRR